MKRVFSCILVLVMMVIPLTACRKNSDDSSIYSYYEYLDESGNPTTEASGDTAGTNSNKGTTTSKKTGTNKDSSEIIKQKLDMKGKTYTMAITEEDQYNTTSFKAMISAFQTKYNCKIKTYSLEFAQYNSMVSKKMSTGTAYDICYMHGSMFPTGPIMGIYADLNAAVKQIGITGISMDRSNYFEYKNKLYGLCPAKSSCFPCLFYYNTLLFQENGLEDPRTLYNNGGWTWDKIFEMGREVTDPTQQIYFLSSTYRQTQAYGLSLLSWKDGKPVLNMRAEKTKKGLQLLQKIYYGNDAIGTKGTNESDQHEGFYAGRTFMFHEESSKYPGLATNVKKSMAFKKNINNLKIVPLPLMAENTSKGYPTGWYSAICAGEGSDPRVAVLWANFVATYKSTVKGNNEFSDADKALVDKLNENTLPAFHGSYTTGDIDTLRLHYSFLAEIRNGEDVSKIVDKYYPQYVAAIEAVVGKGNYIAN